MSIELKIPDVGESIQEVQIGKWLKQEGDRVELDEDVVELETDKASMELPAPADGVLAEILKKEGEAVSIGDVIARIEEKDDQPAEEQREKSKGDESKKPKKKERKKDAAEQAEPEAGENESHEEKKQPAHDKEKSNEAEPPRDERAQDEDETIPATPAARRALRKHGLTTEEVQAEGKQLRPEDVERHIREAAEQEERDSEEEPAERQSSTQGGESDLEEVVPMSLIRRKIAQRLVEAQQQAALLTTFNEIDVSAVIELRQEYRQQFQEEYGIDLGFMPFFVKATIDALRHFPEINAEIRDDKIVYRHYYHIGIAIGGGKGLVVPVLRFAERMSFAEIEEAIADFAKRAQSNKLEPEELEGGTFTITNGGVYGSLLSTPIVNPPQSGVLGMHAIQERPVGRDGQIVLRPMMYVALTYDHRIVDGREAVSFLKRLKEAIEEPARMLIEV